MRITLLSKQLGIFLANTGRRHDDSESHKNILNLFLISLGKLFHNRLDGNLKNYFYELSYRL